MAALSTGPQPSEIEEKWRSKIVCGRFEIPWSGFQLPGPVAVMKFMGTKSESNIPSSAELDKVHPVLHPDGAVLQSPPPDKVQTTWIGHATVLVQMDGVNVLTDPIFSDFCGPVSMKPVPKRYRKVPLSIDELPRIDAIVISHNHFDHLDIDSVKKLTRRFPQLTWFVPKGLQSWMVDSGVARDQVKEMDWWEDQKIGDHSDVKFVFTPAQHWCRRGMFDRNKVLWGSWCVLGPSKRFYFAGDTGYSEEGLFREIGKRYGPFDLAAIPIGAYSPREFMKSQHINPEEALIVHKELNAKKSLGIHWGTFNLSNEYFLEPKQKIEAAMKDENPKSFITVNLGETFAT